MEMAYNEYINEYYAKIGEAGWRGWGGGTAQPFGGPQSGCLVLDSKSDWDP